MDLRTRYLGMRLAASADRRSRAARGRSRHACGRSRTPGAAMLVLRSLYEEEITGEQMEAFLNTEQHSGVVRRGGDYSRPTR